MRLQERPGIEVRADVPDIRPFAHDAAAVVLPIRCGAGIKNKLLEAAALGRPIVATPAAVRGLPGHRANLPFLVCRQKDQWLAALRRLWSDPGFEVELGRRARKWVERHFTWNDAATQLVEWLNDLPCRRPERTASPDDPRQRLAA